MKRKELKAYGMDDPAVGDEYEMYKVSEVDKVIAELKAKLQNVSEILKETREWLIDSQKLHKRCADNAVKVIRRQKRKRCLAMASNCRLRARWFGDNAFYKKEQWALQWHRRWLKIAEKFKEV